jgi:hypothetical protein
MGLVGRNSEFIRLQTERVEANRERSRKRVVWLIFLVYWLLILEGILRKWVLPEFSNALFFIRDPFLLLVYFLALKNGMWPRLQGFFLIAVLLSVIVGLLVVVQLATDTYTNTLLAAYGWRAYFLYIPLAFIMRDQFKADDITRLMRHTMLLSVPIAVLAALQFFSPPSSWINVQAFDGIMGRIRPAGTFSSVTGQWMFVSSTVCFVISLWITRARERAVGRTLLLMSTAAVFVCLAVSISRGMIMQSALVILSAMFAGMVMRGGASTVRAWVFPILLLLIGAVLFPVLLPEAYEVTVARWGAASTSESTHQFGLIGRALYSFTLFMSYIPLTPLLGFGMGIGGNASRMVEGIKLPIVAEDEWSRQIVDIGPVLGLLYILFRVAFFVVLGVRALGATRRSGQALPVILFGFIGITFLNGQITGHGTINGYAWIFVGLLMASIRLSDPKTRKGS